MDLDKFFKQLESLPVYEIELGVFTSDAKREDKKDFKTKKKISKASDVTNAELMFIHENGSPLRKIPARPVIKMTIEEANKTMLIPNLSKAIEDFIESDCDQSIIERDLEQFGFRMQNYAEELILSNDGRLAPNAASTIARKGDNHPLFDTGQLSRSIRYRLIKQKS